MTYDALGRKVEEASSICPCQYVYTPTGAKLAVMIGQGLDVAFLPLTNGLTAEYWSSGTVYYHHADWLGSTRFVSTTSRTMHSDNAFSPFGDIYAVSGGGDNLFTGMYQLTASNLYDFPAREYNNEGRWISPDPGGIAAVDPTNPQSWNRYSYALNNPLNHIDPTGLYCLWDDGSFDDAPIDGGIDQAGCGAAGGTWIDEPSAPDTVDIVTADPLPPDDGGFGFGMDPGLFSSQIGGAFLNAVTGAIKTAYCSAVPSGRVSGVNGAAGGVGSVSGSFENVVNYNTGQSSFFVSGGLGVGWNGGASGSVFTGYLWGLGNSNANYLGGFTTVSGGAGLGGFISRSSGGLTSSSPSGLLPSSSGVTAVGVSLGASLIPTPTGGVSFTNYSKPFGNVNGGALLNPSDAAFYLLRRPCQ